jgi:hypothetical protein
MPPPQPAGFKTMEPIGCQFWRGRLDALERELRAAAESGRIAAPRKPAAKKRTAR